MFNFQSNFLKNAYYTFWGQRLPLMFEFSSYVTGKIEGSVKEHSNGNIPLPVVKQSLTETRITVIPPKHPGKSDVNIVSIGSAIEGMLDYPPNDPKARPIPVGSPVYLLTSILIHPDKLEVKTSFAITPGEFNRLKATEISLEEWEIIWFKKTGTAWVLTDRELARRQKEK